MAAVAITGAAWPAYPTADLGPYQDGSGNLWVIAYEGSQPSAFKSADNGATWDGGTATGTNGGTDLLDSAFDSSGGVIYVLTATTGHVLQVWSFTLGTGAWAQLSSATGQPTCNANNSGSQYPAFLTRRSDGTFIVSYISTSTFLSMSVNYKQVCFITCSAVGAWGSETLMTGMSANSLNYQVRCATLGASDRTVMMSNSDSGTNAFTRGVSSANAIDATISGSITGTLPAGFSSLYYNATLGKLVLASHDSGGGTYLATRATDANAATWTYDTNAIGTSQSGTFTPAVFFYAGTTLYVFFRDTSSARLYKNSATTTTWTTASAAQVEAATAVVGISVGAVTGATCGLIWGDSGVHFDLFGVTSITHADAPRGTLILASLTAEQDRHASTPAGRLTLAGSVVDAWTHASLSHADAPSGQLLLARGAGAETSVAKSAPAGLLTLAGRIGEASTASSAPSGGVALAGTVAEKAGRADAPAGQLLLAARIGETRTHAIAPAGSLTLGGQMVDTSSAATAPAGKLILAGAAAEASTRADARSGNVVLAGARSEASTTGSAPSGGVALAGTVAEASTTTAARAGSLVLSGARAEASTEASTPAGALVLSGRAVETFAHADAPSGRLVLAGRIAENAARAETPRGALILAGSVVDSYTVLSATTTATGQVALAAGSIPITRTGHSIHVRARTTAPAANVVLQAVLYQGATNISGTLTSSALTSSLAEYTLAVSDAAAASITDYTALSVKFSGYSADGETSTIQLAEMWLDIPHQSVSVSHADAPSGNLVLAGRIAEKLTRAGARASALLLAGSVVEFNIAAAPSGADAPDGNLTFAGRLAGADTQRTAPSGRLTLAGQLAQARTHTDSPTGRLTLAGASSRSTTFTPAPAGTLTLAGSAAAKLTWSDRPAGQIVLAGAATDQRQHTAAPAGKITLAGTITDAWAHTGPSNADAPAGNLTLAGATAQKITFTDAPAGPLALAGTLTDTSTASARPAGQMTLGGTLAQVKTYTETPSGRLVFAGPISQSATRTDSPAGTIIFTGATIEQYAPTRHDTPTGTIILAGASTDSYVFIAPDAPQIAYPTDAVISDYPTSAKLASSLAAL